MDNAELRALYDEAVVCRDKNDVNDVDNAAIFLLALMDEFPRLIADSDRRIELTLQACELDKEIARLRKALEAIAAHHDHATGLARIARGALEHP